MQVMVRHDTEEVIFKFKMQYLCQNSGNQQLNQNNRMNFYNRNLNHLPTSVPSYTGPSNTNNLSTQVHRTQITVNQLKIMHLVHQKHR